LTLNFSSSSFYILSSSSLSFLSASVLARAAAAAAFGFLPPFLPFAPPVYAAGASVVDVAAPPSAAYFAANSASFLALSLSFFFWAFDSGAPPALVAASTSASTFPSIFIRIWLFM